MKILDEYKGVAIVYLVITIIAMFWITGFSKPDTNSQVKNDTNREVVINYEKNN